MRIKSDVEFVRRECSSDDCIDWAESMVEYCGQKVSEVKNISDQKVECSFPDGNWWYYTPACLEEDVMLEKGKKYTINDGINVFDFVEAAYSPQLTGSCGVLRHATPTPKPKDITPHSVSVQNVRKAPSVSA